LAFVLAAIACAFSGLCYPEFASMIPVAGSAYTYGYATLGEFVAWIIGWDLILEYAVGAARVASRWSGYLLSFLQDFGIHLPPKLARYQCDCRSDSYTALPLGSADYRGVHLSSVCLNCAQSSFANPHETTPMTYQNIR
jgi:basic amino acid/polyamine antiporter, APA family